MGVVKGEEKRMYLPYILQSFPHPLSLSPSPCPDLTRLAIPFPFLSFHFFSFKTEPLSIPLASLSPRLLCLRFLQASQPANDFPPTPTKPYIFSSHLYQRSVVCVCVYTYKHTYTHIHTHREREIRTIYLSIPPPQPPLSVSFHGQPVFFSDSSPPGDACSGRPGSGFPCDPACRVGVGIGSVKAMPPGSAVAVAVGFVPAIHSWTRPAAAAAAAVESSPAPGLGFDAGFLPRGLTVQELHPGTLADVGLVRRMLTVSVRAAARLHPAPVAGPGSFRNLNAAPVRGFVGSHHPSPVAGQSRGSEVVARSGSGDGGNMCLRPPPPPASNPVPQSACQHQEALEHAGPSGSDSRPDLLFASNPDYGCGSRMGTGMGMGAASRFQRPTPPHLLAQAPTAAPGA